MGDFFRGWRRKTGCVMLLFACVFVGACVRSYYCPETIHLPGDDHAYRLVVSFQGHIEYEQIGAGIEASWTSESFLKAAKWFLEIRPLDTERKIEWQWDRCGFGRGEYRSKVFDSLWVEPLDARDNIKMTIWRFQYWSLVLPMTLLSAYLLLNKPRRVKTPVSQPDGPTAL